LQLLPSYKVCQNLDMNRMQSDAHKGVIITKTFKNLINFQTNNWFDLNETNFSHQLIAQLEQLYFFTILSQVVCIVLSFGTILMQSNDFFKTENYHRV
jgi:hypothetical protein